MSLGGPWSTCGFSSPGVGLFEAVKCYVAASCVGSVGAVWGGAARAWESGCLPVWALLLGDECVV